MAKTNPLRALFAGILAMKSPERLPVRCWLECSAASIDTSERARRDASFVKLEREHGSLISALQQRQTRQFRASIYVAQVGTRDADRADGSDSAHECGSDSNHEVRSLSLRDGRHGKYNPLDLTEHFRRGDRRNACTRHPATASSHPC